MRIINGRMKRDASRRANELIAMFVGHFLEGSYRYFGFVYLHGIVSRTCSSKNSPVQAEIHVVAPGVGNVVVDDFPG